MENPKVIVVGNTEGIGDCGVLEGHFGRMGLWLTTHVE